MMPQCVIEKNIPINKSIGTKLPEKEYNKIIEFVNEGLFLNTADFVREAIREKINNMEAITLRDIPLSQQRKEIIEYAKGYSIIKKRRF